MTTIEQKFEELKVTLPESVIHKLHQYVCEDSEGIFVFSSGGFKNVSVSIHEEVSKGNPISSKFTSNGKDIGSESDTKEVLSGDLLNHFIEHFLEPALHHKKDEFELIINKLSEDLMLGDRLNIIEEREESESDSEILPHMDLFEQFINPYLHAKEQELEIAIKMLKSGGSEELVLKTTSLHKETVRELRKEIINNNL